MQIDKPMFERYTEKARRTILFAKYEAAQLGSPEISTGHILLGLLRDAGLTSSVMGGISTEEARHQILADLPQHKQIPTRVDLPLNDESQEALGFAAEEAGRLAKWYIGNEHILLGLLRIENSYVAQFLTRKGFSADNLRRQIAALKEEVQEQSVGKSSDMPALNGSSEKDVVDPSLKRLVVETVRRVGELVALGEHRGALKLLDDFMAGPVQDRSLRVHLLGNFAAVTASQIGDLQLVKHYCEQVLAYDPGDTMALFKLAHCLAQQGEMEKAKQYASKCYELTLARGGVHLAVTELLKERFPDLKLGS